MQNLNLLNNGVDEKVFYFQKDKNCLIKNTLKITDSLLCYGKGDGKMCNDDYAFDHINVMTNNTVDLSYSSPVFQAMVFMIIIFIIAYLLCLIIN